MQVEEPREGIEVSLDYMYVLTPQQHVDARLKSLTPCNQTIEQRRSPIDILFDSLAERGPNAIAH
jgi:CheB methylesterase